MNDDISIVLTLDDQEFTVGVKNAGKMLKQFERRSAASSREVDKLDLSIDGLAATTRDFTVILATAHAALQTVFAATIGWQKAIMDAAGEIERLEVMMRGMSSATTQAGRDLDAMNASKFITDFAQNAPFKMQALTDTFVKFKTVGIDPMDGSMRSLTDAVSQFGGDSDILHRASIAIQQMMGKGVISMEELRQQLGEAVPSAMQIMARSMKMTVGELVGNIETGTVQSETALKKMLADMAVSFDGAGVRMMTTWSGILQSMETRWKLFLKEVAGDTGDGTSYFNTVKSMVDDLSQWMVSGEAKQFAAEISEAMSALAQGIKAVTVFLYQNRTAIMEVGKVFLFYFVTSRIAMGIAAITAALNRMSMASGVLGTAMGDFRRHMDGARQSLNTYNTQIATAATKSQATGMAVRTLGSTVGRLGMAFMSLAGPIGMAVSLLSTAAFVIQNLQGRTDDLAQSIIRTNGLIATQKDINDLEERRAEITERIAEAEERASLSRRNDKSISGMINDTLIDTRDGALRKLQEELDTLNQAIDTGREGLLILAKETGRAQISRIIQNDVDSISSHFRVAMEDIAEARVEAAGNAEELARLDQMALEANERTLQSKLDLFKGLRESAQNELEGLREASDDANRERIANLESTLEVIAEREAEAKAMARNFAESFNLDNVFIQKPEKGTPKVVKDSERALTAMARILEGFSIKVAQARGKAEEANPHLEGLAERIEQLRDGLLPGDRTMFDQIAEQAIQKAQELHQIQQKIKFERQGEQAFMQMLNRTASALGDTEQARQLRLRVQTRELNEQVRAYEELIDKMREFGVEESFISEFSDSLVEYHAAAMDKIVLDNASAWDKMMREIKDYQADWTSVWKNSMSEATDEIVRFVKEGKFSFSSLVDHILEEILRIQLQKSMTNQLGVLMDFGVKAASAYFGGGAPIDGGFMGQVAATPFANGGIMTAYGPAPLRKYANGGIANSPQVALYGEGSRPEAYVPLPDGRSIPVSMEGGKDAPVVHVNVINQSGQPMEAEQGGGRFDGETYILDVVMKAANRPGNFRDGLKGVMK